MEHAQDKKQDCAVTRSKEPASLAPAASAEAPSISTRCPSPILPAEVPRLPIGRYRFVFVAQTAGAFPAYSGSTWRGAFGHALRRTVCVTRAPRCHGCLLQRSCAYSYVFETVPPAGATKMRRYAAVPHPYVIEPEASGGRRFAPGEQVEVSMVLIGRANAMLSYLVYALARAGEAGLGKNCQGKLRLEAVYQATANDAGGEKEKLLYCGGDLLGEPMSEVGPAQPPPCAPRSMRLRLHTPLRLKREGHYVRPEAFRFADLFSNLLRRISMLSAFHTDTPLEVDFRGLVAQARSVRDDEIRADLRWHDWTRYSSRQQAPMQMGGLVGKILLKDADWTRFWPYLWLGQWVHAGKGATMGLGRYTLE